MSSVISYHGGQKYCNMSDLRRFIGENNIYSMWDNVVKLSVIAFNLDKQLTRTPKQNDKEPIQKELAKVNKDFKVIHSTFQKSVNKAKAKFIISIETTTKPDNMYWLTYKSTIGNNMCWYS